MPVCVATVKSNVLPSVHFIFVVGFIAKFKREMLAITKKNITFADKKSVLLISTKQDRIQRFARF